MKRIILSVIIIITCLSYSGCGSKPVTLTVENWSDYIGVDYSWDIRDESFTVAGIHVSSYEYDLTNRFFLVRGGHLNNVTINVEQHFIGNCSTEGKKTIRRGWLNDELEKTYMDSDTTNDGVIKYSITLPADGNATYLIRDLEHYTRSAYGGAYSDKTGDLSIDQQIRVISITGEFVPE